MTLQNIKRGVFGRTPRPKRGEALNSLCSKGGGMESRQAALARLAVKRTPPAAKHIKPPRPMTHDLLKNIILSFDSEIEKVIIYDLNEGTFFAHLICSKNGEPIELDARPSDAIALAIRFNAPIFAASHVLDEAGI